MNRSNFNLGLILLFVFIFLPVVSSQEVVIKQVTDYDLKRACFNDGAFCSSAATCNFTMLKPNGEVLIDNVGMTNKVTYFNVSLTKAQTGAAGTYDGLMSCTDGSLSGDEAFPILISPSGTNDDSTGYALLLGFIAIFSVGMIIFGLSIQDAPLVLFGGMGLTVLALFTLLNGVGNYRNELTQWGSIIAMSVGAYVSVRTSVELIDG